MKAKILVVEDDKSLRSILLEAISLRGHTPEGVESAELALKRFTEEKFDIVLTDLNLPGKNGLELLPLCLQHDPGAYIILMTAYGTIDVAVGAMKLGAADFLCKPISLNDLFSAIEIALEKIAHAPLLNTKVNSNSLFIAKSAPMLALLEQVETIAPYKLNVLITGETGTGKELVSRSIHQTSPRKKQPFCRDKLCGNS